LPFSSLKHNTACSTTRVLASRNRRAHTQFTQRESEIRRSSWIFQVIGQARVDKRLLQGSTDALRIFNGHHEIGAWAFFVTLPQYTCRKQNVQITKSGRRVCLDIPYSFESDIVIRDHVGVFLARDRRSRARKKRAVTRLFPLNHHLRFGEEECSLLGIGGASFPNSRVVDSKTHVGIGMEKTTSPRRNIQLRTADYPTPAGAALQWGYTHGREVNISCSHSCRTPGFRVCDGREPAVVCYAIGE